MKHTVAGIFLLLFWVSCGGAKEEANSSLPDDSVTQDGTGFVTAVKLADGIEPALVKGGERVFESKCATCHALDKRKIGPPLKGVTQKRSPEWIMNIILHPGRMLKEDAAAKELFKEYRAIMTVPGIKVGEARSVLEYFRSIDAGS